MSIAGELGKATAVKLGICKQAAGLVGINGMTESSPISNTSASPIAKTTTRPKPFNPNLRPKVKPVIRGASVASRAKPASKASIAPTASANVKQESIPKPTGKTGIPGSTLSPHGLTDFFNVAAVHDNSAMSANNTPAAERSKPTQAFGRSKL
jgi:hypothetical protein